RPGKVQQILSNILLNAAQAMAGAGTIEARAHPPQGGKIVLSIRDGAPGIAEDCLPHVSEPFFTTKPPGEGIGLGLAISYEIEQELGGAIRADNPPEGGACFQLVLPPATSP